MGLISFWLLLWIVPFVGVGWIATQKGRSGVGFFFLSSVISPVLAILVLIALPVRVSPGAAAASGNFVPCLSCRRPISSQATVCLFCNTNQTSERRRIEMFESPRLPAIATDDDTRPCPVCAEAIKKAAVKCRFCQSTVEPVAARRQS